MFKRKDLEPARLRVKYWYTVVEFHGQVVNLDWGFEVDFGACFRLRSCLQFGTVNELDLGGVRTLVITSHRL